MRKIPAILINVFFVGMLAACSHAPTAPAASAAPSIQAVPAAASTVILISVDGLRATTVGTGMMPTLDAMAASGVRAASLTPSYPTQTFPNHYTLVTGLRPDHHGVVHNTMRDEGLGKFVSKGETALDGRWWGGEPIWVTLQKQGGIAATMFWPGSEAKIAGQRPRYYMNYDKQMPANARVDQVLAWLDLPAAEQPRLITLYFENYDVAGHATGADSAESIAALKYIDAALARLRDGLRSRKLDATTNLIVVSDHGMITVRGEDVRYLDDLVPADTFEAVHLGPLAGLNPKPGHVQQVEKALIGRHDRFECWRKQDLPARWHYGKHPRVPAILCQADPGWRVVMHGIPESKKRRGEHSYAPEAPEMGATFVAIGPDFVSATQLPAFDNVDVYPLMAHLLHITPAANDGTLAPLLPALRDATP
ncbi:MAG: ectonucleotide pyrophosphatase/phosphodiesterase [Thermomonas sp.]